MKTIICIIFICLEAVVAWVSLQEQESKPPQVVKSQQRGESSKYNEIASSSDVSLLFNNIHSGVPSTM